MVNGEPEDVPALFPWPPAFQAGHIRNSYGPYGCCALSSVAAACHCWVLLPSPLLPSRHTLSTSKPTRIRQGSTTGVRRRETGPVRVRHDVAGALSRSYLFEDVSLEDLAPLAAMATTRSYVRGEAVFRIGDAADEICVVLDGEVKDVVLDEDGFEVVYFVHGPGMTFGEPGYFAVDRNRLVTVIATVPTVLAQLRRRELAPFIQRYPSVKDRALEGLASATRWQSTMIASMFRRTLTDRVGLRLLELIDSNGQRVRGQAVTPRISQSTLAAMVGVSRENVNRALRVLADDGLVHHDGGRYVIDDEPALRARIGRDWPLAQRRDRRLP